MSIPDDILATLRASAEPMTNAQIRAELDLPAGGGSTTRVAGALNSLVSRGAVERTTAAEGGYVYTPVRGWQPARRTGGVASVKGVTRASRRPAARTRPATLGEAPEAPPPGDGNERIHVGTVILRRSTVRTLVAGILMFGGEQLGDSLREAVIDATREAA